MDRRYYTLDEVNERVPELEQSFSRIIQIRAQMKIIYRRLDDHGLAPAKENFVIDVDGAPIEIIRDRANFQALLETMREETHRVHETGALIKDVETGLVDFWGKNGKDDVLFCWRYGEKEVGFFHDLDGGFSGRRPVSDL